MADKTIYETSDGKVFTGGYGGDVNSFRAESEARAHQDQLDREANKTPAQRAREEKEYKDSQAAITVREVEVRQELERKLITAKQGDIDAIMWVIGCYSQGMHYRVYDYEKALEWSFILLDKKHPGAHVYIRNGLAGLTRSIEIEDSSSRAKLKQAYQKYKSMAARKGVDLGSGTFLSIIFGIACGFGLNLTLFYFYRIITGAGADTTWYIALPLFAVCFLINFAARKKIYPSRIIKSFVMLAFLALAIPGYLAMFRILPDADAGVRRANELTAGDLAVVNNHYTYLTADNTSLSDILKDLKEGDIVTVTGEKTREINAKGRTTLKVLIPVEHEGVSGYVKLEYLRPVE